MSFSINLTLSEGPHSIKITVECESLYDPDDSALTEKYAQTYSASDTIHFSLTIPQCFKPTVTLLPSGNTFNSSSVPLVFTINQNCSWLGYSLDNHANVTIAGNTTLTELSNGNHTLVVYANGTLGGMGESQTIEFIVAVPFPTTLVALITVSVAIASVGLLVYFRRHRD